MEELIDVLDEHGIKTGEVLPRSQVHKNELWHRIIVIAIINNDNKILIQQRSACKDKNPNKWDISTTGHISSGQDSLMAAAREINEEIMINLGYIIDIKNFRYMFSFWKEEKVANDHIDRQFYDFFILRKDSLDIDKIKFQESEVQALKLVDLSELLEMQKNGELVDRPEIYNELANYIFRI